MSKWSRESILDIFVPKSFQWYNELFNPMGFDPYNRSLKIRESIGNLIPKVGVHLRVWGFIPSHSPTFLRARDVTLKLPSWLAPLQTLTLVTNLRIGLWQWLSLGRLFLLMIPSSQHWRMNANLMTIICMTI
jgi:hypothetical protein